MAIQIILQFNNKQLTLPINPEELQIIRSAKNDDINIIGLGQATRKGEPGLIGLSIDSFFPGPNSYYYNGAPPKMCIEFIQSIWETENTNNNVGKLVTSGLPIDLNMYFVIDQFDYDHKAGEEEDIYYTLKLKKYVPYGVKTVDVQLSGLAAARASALATSNTASGTGNSANTYTVQKGDCLWNIAKACTGNGNDWRQLYELNKSVIGSNPNLIKPGQVLTLPAGWKSPQKVAKLSSVSVATSSATKPVISNTAVAAGIAGVISAEKTNPYTNMLENTKKYIEEQKNKKTIKDIKGPYSSNTISEKLGYTDDEGNVYSKIYNRYTGKGNGGGGR